MTTRGPRGGIGRRASGVGDVLESLRRKELIYRREASAFAGAREYIFKHALLRDVTYESVLKRERRALSPARGRRGWRATAAGASASTRASSPSTTSARSRRRRRRVVRARGPAGARDLRARDRHRLLPQGAQLPLPGRRRASPRPKTNASALKRACGMEWYEGLGEVLRVQARYAESIEAYEADARGGRGFAVAPPRRRARGTRSRSCRAARATTARCSRARSAPRCSRAGRGAAPARKGAGARAEPSESGLLALRRRARRDDARRPRARARGRLGDGGRRVRADCLKSLGMAYHMLGRFEQAEEFKSLSLGTLPRDGDRRSVGNLLNSLARRRA